MVAVRHSIEKQNFQAKALVVFSHYRNNVKFEATKTVIQRVYHIFSYYSLPHSKLEIFKTFSEYFHK